MPPTTPAPAKRKRGEGQWKLGYREPLNPNERSKRDDDGLNVRARIENIYAKGGFDSIDPADLRGRFRWWGLYTQRKPGIDGGRTASLEPEELDDRYFMLRIRCDGGALSARVDRARCSPGAGPRGAGRRGQAPAGAESARSRPTGCHAVRTNGQRMPGCWERIHNRAP
jgi:hypothetical protein